MKNMWIVDWIDNENINIQHAYFQSCQDANNWITCKYDDAKYNPDGFNVISEPYINKSCKFTKIMPLWFDSHRPAPNGFTLIKNVEYFVDCFAPGFCGNDKFLFIVSLDTKRDNNGDNFIDVLNYFANHNLTNIKVHIHGNDTKIKQQIIQRAKEYNQELINNIDDYINESKLDVIDNDKSIYNNASIKLWIDDIRPAPNGYIWIKSVNEFIDYLVEHGINDIVVFDFDYDAGDYQNDGGDYIKCLDYLEHIGADNINVHIHSANPVGRSNMQRVIKKNDWNEVFDILEDDALFEDVVEDIEEAEDSKSKDKIIDALKKASKDFQKNAANNEPDQFAKIVVAFDDLIGGVGKYDFKKKKVLKEEDIEQEK